MLKVYQVKCPIEHTDTELFQALCNKLKCRREDVVNWKIVKRSIDARKKPMLFYSYILLAKCRNEEKIFRRLKKSTDIMKDDTVPYRFPESGDKPLRKRPVIIGTGPAGLFCGLELARAGFRPILLERGKDVERRRADVEAFWQGGMLQENSNVQFGEGGAGTFSDGKLNTLLKDKHGRNAHVLETFVEFGAEESILYDQKPHIGTDVLKDVVKRMREEIISLGGDVRFESQVTDIFLEDIPGHLSCEASQRKIPGKEGAPASTEQKIRALEINGKERLETDIVVLAIGHSARDTLFMLQDRKLEMEAKPFAVGFRVQHPQQFINESQYGSFEDTEQDVASILGAAAYKLTAKAQDGRGVYSFCMCPGGYVVNASSEENHLAVNGMSYSRRDGDCANSAIIVAVTPEDYAGDALALHGQYSPLSGIFFQRALERRACEAAGGKIPVQKYGDYQDGLVRKGILERAAHHDDIRPFQPAIKGAFSETDITGLLPTGLNKAFCEGMEQMNRKISGFASDEVWLCGIESRTSSPVRICRDELFQSNIRGIYPCGEGAGYAGGITSAAMDGMKVAEEIARTYRPSWA